MPTIAMGDGAALALVRGTDAAVFFFIAKRPARRFSVGALTRLEPIFFARPEDGLSFAMVQHVMQGGLW